MPTAAPPLVLRVWLGLRKLERMAGGVDELNALAQHVQLNESDVFFGLKVPGHMFPALECLLAPTIAEHWFRSSPMAKLRAMAEQGLLPPGENHSYYLGELRKEPEAESLERAAAGSV